MVVQLFVRVQHHLPPLDLAWTLVSRGPSGVISDILLFDSDDSSSLPQLAFHPPRRLRRGDRGRRN